MLGTRGGVGWAPLWCGPRQLFWNTENFTTSPSILTTRRWWRPGRLTPLRVCKLAQKCRAFLTNHSYGIMCRPFLSLITITTSFIDNLLSSLDLTWF